MRQCSWQCDSEVNTLLHVLHVYRFTELRVKPPTDSVTVGLTACEVYIPLTNGTMSTSRQRSNSSRSSSLWNTGILWWRSAQLPDNDFADSQPPFWYCLPTADGDDSSGSEISLESPTSFCWSTDVIALPKNKHTRNLLYESSNTLL